MPALERRIERIAVDAEISPSQEAREANVLSLLLLAPGNHHTSTFEQGDQTRIFYRFMRINHVERAANFVSPAHLVKGKDVSNLRVKFRSRRDFASSVVQQSITSCRPS
jgi:hypothetical protein